MVFFKNKTWLQAQQKVPGLIISSVNWCLSCEGRGQLRREVGVNACPKWMVGSPKGCNEEGVSTILLCVMSWICASGLPISTLNGGCIEELLLSSLQTHVCWTLLGWGLTGVSAILLPDPKQFWSIYTCVWWEFSLTLCMSKIRRARQSSLEVVAAPSSSLGGLYTLAALWSHVQSSIQCSSIGRRGEPPLATAGPG